MAAITFMCWFTAYQMYVSVSENSDGYHLSSDKYHTVYVVGEILTPIDTKFCEDDDDE